MKIAPFCLILALLSPAAALKGSHHHPRKLQDETTVDTAAAEDAEAAVEGEDEVEMGPVPELFNVDAALETAAEDVSASAATAVESDGDESEEAAIPEDMISDATTTTQKQKDSDGEEAAAEAVDESEEAVAEPEQQKWTGDTSEAIENDDAAKNKDNTYYDSSRSDSGGSAVAGSACSAFCNLYLSTCDSANAFFNPSEPRGTEARRRLIAGFEINPPTRLNAGVFSRQSACVSACAGFPRPYDPARYLNPRALGVNSIGDTFWCRQTHLELARDTSTPFAKQVHCPAASPSGGGVCTNVEITNRFASNKTATAWEWIRSGAETGRNLGYCQMYYDDFVADCTNAGIDDRTLPLALALLPLETEIIILNNNVGKQDASGRITGNGLTKIPSGTFRNLLCPECIEAIIIDDGMITTLESGSFTALRNVQHISLNMQLIATLPSDLLNNAPLLREFTMYNTRDRPGQLTALPNNFFRQNPLLQRIVISGHRNLASLPSCTHCNSRANDVSILAVLIMSNNGLTTNGVASGMFNNLGNLVIWDFSGNQFTTVPNGWFSAGWAHSLTNVHLHSNPIALIDGNTFDRVSLLQTVLLHDTDLISIPVGLFANNPHLITYTISPKPS